MPNLSQLIKVETYQCRLVNRIYYVGNINRKDCVSCFYRYLTVENKLLFGHLQTASYSIMLRDEQDLESQRHVHFANGFPPKGILSSAPRIVPNSNGASMHGGYFVGLVSASCIKVVIIINILVYRPQFPTLGVGRDMSCLHCFLSSAISFMMFNFLMSSFTTLLQVFFGIKYLLAFDLPRPAPSLS